MLETCHLHRTGEDHRRVHQRAEAFGRELLRDGGVIQTLTTERQQALFEGGVVTELGQRPDRNRHLQRGRVAAFPHDPGVNLVTAVSMDHHFIDQAPKQGFFLRGGEHRRRPESR